MLNELWHSIRALPLWVKLWMLFLGPINVCTIFFLDEPYGIWIAILAYGGMIPLGIIAVIQRGLSKAGSIPHVIAWTPLVIALAWWLAESGPNNPTYNAFLTVLLVANLISLIFDYIDSIKWLRGAREILGRENE